MSLWITAKRHFGKSYSPIEHDPDTFSNVVLFDNEIDALRYANEHGLKAVPIRPGESLEGLDL